MGCLVSVAQEAADGEMVTTWRYVTQRPKDNWMKAGFNDQSWKTGPGGFGSRRKALESMKTVTNWDTPDIWIRRNFQLNSLPKQPALRIFHDEDAEVYLNGTLVRTFEGYAKDYFTVPIDGKHLKRGTNLIAVHCHQTRGGQFVDAAVIEGAGVLKTQAAASGGGHKVRIKEGAGANMPTPWTDSVTPDNVLPEHPSPMFERADWLSLNGPWDYAIEPSGFTALQGFVKQASLTEGTKPAKWDGKLLVPFAVDSPLSGVGHILRPEERIWYERTFTLPANMRGKRIHLHFQASDWETSVYLNGNKVGQHRGGYDPFTFDISDALIGGANRLTVCVWDGTEQNGQPLGKQIMPENRKGFRYQPTGGIWQPVWLEAVPKHHLASAAITTDQRGLNVKPVVSGGSGQVRVTVKDGGRKVAENTGAAGAAIRIDVPNPKLWSPESPYLYQVELAFLQEGRVIDSVKSHAGLRSIKVGSRGEILLNGKPVVMFGPLDQGYWPDGVLTPPSDEAIIYDLQYLRDIGCNMVRVHIKTHPARWYWHADRLGLLIIQDMVCTPKYGQTVTSEVAANWLHEFDEMIRDFGNHPSIISWCVFNEAWGQHDTMKVTEWTQRRDPTRLILSTSGWTDHGAGDILDVHDYSTYPSLPLEDANGRTITFGEVGGHNLLLEGHKWHPDQTQRPSSPLTVSGGRMHFDSIEDLNRKYDFYFRNLRHFATRAGCSSFVYTQITDVEHECNGFMTYDRKLSKLPRERFREIHNRLYTSPEYTALTRDGNWKQQTGVLPRGGAVVKKRGGPPALSHVWPKLIGSWTDANLPYDSEKPIVSNAQKPMLALKQTFEVAATPRHAVLEIRFRNPSWRTEVPPERLDGHQGRSSVITRIGVVIDGRLIRTHSMKVHVGHGRSVSYLELTDEEVASLTRGEHEIGLIFPNASGLYTLDVSLLEY